MPANTVKVDRSTKWGNPFRAHPSHDPAARAHAVHLFAALFTSGDDASRGPAAARYVQISVADIRNELAGKNLACWCPLDGPCHADILLWLANDAGTPNAAHAKGPPESFQKR